MKRDRYELGMLAIVTTVIVIANIGAALGWWHVRT